MSVDYTTWCRKIFENLDDQGVWIVPRSGMVFQKKNNALFWVGTVPFENFLTSFVLSHSAIQHSEFLNTCEKFGEADITVKKADAITHYKDEATAFSMLGHAGATVFVGETSGTPRKRGERN